MSIDKCRVCGNKFLSESLQYANMPKAAQYLPDASSIKDDTGVDLKLYQCVGCGLIQLDSDPVPYYREVIRAAAISKEMSNFRSKQFANFVQKFSLRGKKIIEIGCGRGEYLSIMQQSGADVYGLEFSPASVDICTKNNLNVSKGFIDNASVKLSHAPFDAFFMLSFLEHLPDPNSVLSGINANLVDGAIGLVEVPNFDVFIKNNVFYEFIPDHLFYFTKETLATLLSLNGFEVLNCTDAWHNFLISATVRKRKGLGTLEFHKHQKQLKTEIDQYLSRFKNKRVAVWGAGHVAFAILVLMELSDKILCVIDSAPFKQGKYTPATHIQIVPPNAVDIRQVDAIIVMAGSYSDEVVKIIHKMFGTKVAVAILRGSKLEVVCYD